MRISRFIAKLAMVALVASLVAPVFPAVAATDTTAPVVTNLAPVTIYRNVPTVFTAHYTDNSAGVASCTLLINSFVQGEGAMTLSVPTGNSGDASQTYTYTGPLSTITARVRCTDQAPTPNTGTTSYVDVTVFVDSSPPQVTGLRPLSATAGSPVTIQADYTESGVGMDHCTLVVESVSVGSMSLSGSTASLSYTFPSADDYTVEVNCYDKAGNLGGDNDTVAVSASGGGGATATMGTLSPTTATAGVSTTFSTTIVDPSVKWTVCALYVNSASVATMTRSGSNVTGSYTFSTAGSFPAYIQCQKNDTPAEPVVTGTVNVTVSSAGGGDSATMGSLSPSTALAGISTSFSTTITDSSAKWFVCALYVSDISVATMTRSGSNVTGSYTFPAVGNYQTYIQCQKNDTPASPVKTGTIAVAVSAPGAADTAQPTIASVNPSTATTALPVTVIADASDNVGITSCTLTVDNVLQGDMTLSTSALGPTIRQASRVHLFSSVGTHNVDVRCLDAAGNAGTYTRTVSVVAAGTPPPPPTTSSNDTDSDRLTNSEEASIGTSPTVADTDGDQLSDYEEVRIYHSDPLKRDTDGDGFLDGHEVLNGYSPTGPGRLMGTTPNTGTLIKMPCPIGAGVNHPCKAVYFYGRDGKRHPFPHEKTYFSWYPNFGSVQNVSQEALSALPLGTNVTYRPGVRLVKFQTLNTVYAVTRGGALRALTSESVAVAIYGTAWNRQVDDIGDAFFSNYTFGTDITQANQYVPLAETAAVLSIDDNL